MNKCLSIVVVAILTSANCHIGLAEEQNTSTPDQKIDIVNATEGINKSGTKVQIAPVAVARFGASVYGAESALNAFGAIGALVGGAISSNTNNDQLAAEQKKQLSQIGSMQSFQMYLVDALAKDLAKCDIQSNKFTKVVAPNEEIIGRSPELYFMNKADIDPSSSYLIEVAMGPVTIITSLVNSRLGVPVFAKVYKLPNLELVGKYSDINLFGKTILEHYKDGDSQRNEEILSVTKKKIEDQAKSLASDICGSKTSW